MPGEEKQKRYLLRLYNANRNGEMYELAKRFEEVLGDEHHKVEVIDVIEDPERAIEDNVFVTPTMLKALPEPVRRVIGDISDPQKTLGMLGFFTFEEEQKDEAKKDE